MKDEAKRKLKILQEILNDFKKSKGLAIPFRISQISPQ